MTCVAVASLLELQRAFAAALRDPRAACAVSPAANLSIYRNNAEFAFRNALEIAYPVLKRRVGDDYFRQLAARYRSACPSRSGDLHWAGSSFAEFLATHLGAGDYAWLADLARLEWACQEAAVERELPVADADSLAAFPPDDLECLRFTLQPSLRLISSPYPVFSVWIANQSQVAPPVDQSLQDQRGMVRSRRGKIEVEMLDADVYAYLETTIEGATLGEAMQAAALDERRLTYILGLLFAEELVISMATAGRPRE